MSLAYARRFVLPSAFCEYRALNLTTRFSWLYVTMSSGMGVAMTRKVTPWVQGGVVSEPTYWKSGCEATAAATARKSRAPVVVDVPGTVTFARFCATALMSAVVPPSSLSWNRIVRTVSEPSVYRAD
jgi:hypothetical protein